MTLEITQTLYLKRGRRLAQVTPEQASKAMDIIRAAALAEGYGSSQTPTLALFDIDGKRVGYVSYNGRVWLGAPGGIGNVEVPLTGVKTAAAHEAEGWKDFKCAS